MKNTRTLLLPLVFVFLLSCLNDDDANRAECRDIACTEIFITLNVSVKHNSGEPVALDAFQVLALANNEDLTRELSADVFEIAREIGAYPLFGDEYANRFQNDTLQVVFKGFIDGQEVASSEYKVGADCCHVMLFEGDTDIIIDQ